MFNFLEGGCRDETEAAEMIGYKTERWVSKAYWVAIQTALHCHGISPGEIDGVRGKLTDAALVRFKRANGLSDRPYIGPITEDLLWRKSVAEAIIEQPPKITDEPPWLRIARAYLGLKEIKGKKHNKQILSWWQAVGASWFRDDETPWCGAFVGGVLSDAGIDILPGGKAARARAWEKWGRELNGPAVGCVVTLWRRSKSSGNGHVFFLLGKRHKRLVGIGGNQGDAVTVANFDPARVTSYRWPSGKPAPKEMGFNFLPVILSDGHASSSES